MVKLIELQYRFDTLAEVFPLMKFFQQVHIEDDNGTDGYVIHDNIVRLTSKNCEVKEVPLKRLDLCDVNSVTIYEHDAYSGFEEDDIIEDMQTLWVEVKDLAFDHL